MTTNGADGRAALQGVNVSARAQAAIRRAIAELGAVAGEDPRLSALVSKLRAIESPTDFDADRAASVAKALADSERLAKSEDASPAVRERMREVSMELQRAHLSRYSAGGAAVWEDSARAAGLV